jgi:type II secretory pathway pseudopilin PulG
MSSWRPDAPRTRSRRGATRWPADAGLTLLELLVAAAVSVILMIAIYYVYTASTRGYRVHAQVMGAMQQARFAMAQLQRDVAAAGFLATPQSANDNNVCPKPAGRLRGIVVRAGGAANANPRVLPQNVTMLGAFWSQHIFFTQSVIGNVVTLQGPADDPGFPGSAADFDRIFQIRRFLRIVNADQFEMYIPISSADYANRAVTLGSPAPGATPPDFCGVQGFGVGLEVTVVGFVRYLLAADDSEIGKVDLVRQEIDGSDPALERVVANSTVRVAEWAADLQFYDFSMDVDRTGRNPTLQQFPTLTDVETSGTQGLGLLDTARPQDLRAVTIKLTTRTRDEDETFPFRIRAAATDPLDSYEVDPSMVGSARTSTLAARVSFPAFTVRNVK